MKTLLILTGPQGSGNHLWSKIFSSCHNIYGWKDLTKEYWIPHDKEPFVNAWNDPELLSEIKFSEEYAVTSRSCPYMHHGALCSPDYHSFILKAKDLFNVKIAIIGRDQTILQYQQERVRGAASYHHFQHSLALLSSYNPIFLSTELLYLYKSSYIESISKILEIPINITQEQIDEILIKDPNKKYISKSPNQELDVLVRQVSGLPPKA